MIFPVVAPAKLSPTSLTMWLSTRDYAGTAELGDVVVTFGSGLLMGASVRQQAVLDVACCLEAASTATAGESSEARKKARRA